MTTRDEAARYIARGWQVVPLKPESKQCVDTDWRTRVYVPEDFGPTHNIGIKSVGGLVDVDCDCAEAVFMADAFLPKTPAIYGRNSRRRSHWLFRCPEIQAPVALKDFVENKNLVEVRVNHQSMAPPSKHPEGEQVEWEPDSNLQELTVEKALLLRSVQLVATGAEMAKHYNPPGARHDWGLALAGFLRRLGITEHEAGKLFRKTGEWARDEKAKDRLEAVRTTYTLSEDTPTTGGKKLEELMPDGKEFVVTLRKIWGDDAAGVSKTRLEEMNQKHAVLFRQGGKLTIMTEEREDGKLQLRFTNRADFGLLYPQKVQTALTSTGKPINTSVAEAWLVHPKRRFYRGIELAPNGNANDGYYNLWQGFSVEPKKGDWPLFRQHLMLIASNKREHAAYILKWLAETVQHPERPIGIALAFQGEQGVGKSTFAKWFGSLFGAHFLHLDSEHRLLGNFNAHLHNAIVVLADEAVWAGGKQGLGALKRMITEDTLAIEPKGLDVLTVKNMLHMLICSNEDWVIPSGFDNRRFAIFGTSTQRQNDARFFAAVREELFERGGLAALLYDLLEHQSDVNLRLIPETPESLEQKSLSANTEESWWLEKLHRGSLSDIEMDWPEQIQKDVLHGDYLRFLERHRKGGRSPHATETQLGRFLTRRTPLRQDQVMESGVRSRIWRVPALVTCRAAWVTACKWPEGYDWGDDGAREPGKIPF